MKHTILAFAVALLIAGCSKYSPSDNPVNEPSTLGKPTETEAVYQYVGYGSNGQPVVRGTMTFSVSTVGRVTGRWDLRGGDPTRIGPQVGQGMLMGTMSNPALSVNLNPQVAGNNVLLTGRFSRTEYAGRWEWVTARGVMNSGTFRATAARIPSVTAAD